MFGLEGVSVAVAAAGTPRLDLDVTFLVQIGLFVGLWLFLGRYLFRPYLAARGERERLNQGTRDAAAALNVRMAQLQSELDLSLQEVTCDALSTRQELLVDAKRQAMETLCLARTQADALVAETQRSLARDVVQCRLALDAKVDGLARALADRLLR